MEYIRDVCIRTSQIEFYQVADIIDMSELHSTDEEITGW